MLQIMWLEIEFARENYMKERKIVEEGKAYDQVPKQNTMEG